MYKRQIDNSAVSAGSAYVKLYASAGSMGYVDAAKKTTSVVDGKTYTCLLYTSRCV